MTVTTLKRGLDGLAAPASHATSEGNHQALALIHEWLAAYSGRDVALADLLCDRHASNPHHVAACFVDTSGQQESLTFAALRDRSASP